MAHFLEASPEDMHNENLLLMIARHSPHSPSLPPPPNDEWIDLILGLNTRRAVPGWVAVLAGILGTVP